MRRLVFRTLVAAAALFAAGSARAQPAPHCAGSSERVALLVGNAAYATLSPLQNPHRDTRALADVFCAHGFTVHRHEDLTAEAFERALSSFETAARFARTAVIYFSGHGYAMAGRNFLAPTDARVSCGVLDPNLARIPPAVRGTLVALDEDVLPRIAAVPNQIVILDACRENAVAACKGGGAAGFQKGFVRASDRGRAIFYATQDGKLANDQGFGETSPLVRGLVAAMKAEPGREWLLTLAAATREVAALTDRRQIPNLDVSIPPEGCLAEKCGVAALPAPAVAPPPPVPVPLIDPLTLVRADYERAERIGSEAAWAAFLATGPPEPYASFARAAIAKLTGPAAPAPVLPPPAAAPVPAPPPVVASAAPSPLPAVAPPVLPSPVLDLLARQWGVELESLDDDRRRRHGVASNVRGVVFATVHPGGPAALKGVEAGHVIVEAAEQAVAAPADVARIAAEEQTRGRRSLALLVRSASGRLLVALALPEASLAAPPAPKSIVSSAPVAPAAPADDNPAGRCDRLAAAVFDNRRSPDIPGVAFGEIRHEFAVPACVQAVAAAPTEPRFSFQLGRALEAAGLKNAARDAYRTAADAGYPAGMRNLGLLAETKEEQERWRLKAAEAGLVEAMFDIAGDLTSAGKHAEARLWHERVAAAGDPQGFVSIGATYEYGTGVTVDYAEAKRWYDRAVAMGSFPAVLAVARLHRDGKGTPRSLEAARALWQRVFDDGSDDDREMLALDFVIWFDWDEKPEALSERITWSRRLALRGIGSAMFSMGDFHRIGRGVEKDRALARQWYERAGAAGYLAGWVELGKLAEGEGDVAPDYAEARRLYLLAAEKNWSDAMYRLGLLYENGRGVGADLATARQWYEKAAAGFSFDAKERLTALDLAATPPAERVRREEHDNKLLSLPPQKLFPAAPALPPPNVPQPTPFASLPSPPWSTVDDRALKAGQSFRDCDACPEMVVIPAGSFLMGSPAREAGRGSEEGPQKNIAFPRAFAIGKFEVTFAEWDACVNDGGCRRHLAKDESWGRDRRPVINVSWNDASAYVEWLSRQSSKPYRLLTEAEWEYSARAGRTTPFAFGATVSADDANFNAGKVYGGGRTGLYRGRTSLVGMFRANAFGVFDMHGNVQEWVADCYSGYPLGDARARSISGCNLRVVRSGSWASPPSDLRSAARQSYQPDYRGSTVGFRVARSLAP